MAEMKGRVLFLAQYLLEHTDDEHALTTDELIRVCKEAGRAAKPAPFCGFTVLDCGTGQ